MSSEHDPPDLPDPPVLEDLRAALDALGPLPLLQVCSTLIAALETGPKLEQLDIELPPVPTLPQFTELLAADDRTETTAALSALAIIADDDLVRRRAANAVAVRRHPMPDWLVDLEPVSVVGAVSMGNSIDGGASLLVGVITGTGDHLTAVAYVDGSRGRAVTDAFVRAATVGSLVDQLTEIAVGQPGTIQQPLRPADARAKLTDAIVAGDALVPPPLTDTWPGCRPLVTWILRQLPDQRPAGRPTRPTHPDA